MKFCVFRPWSEFATPPVIAAFPFQSNQRLSWIREGFTPALGAGGQDSLVESAALRVPAGFPACEASAKIKIVTVFFPDIFYSPFAKSGRRQRPSYSALV
jgi:hypothetical protein